MNPNKKEKKLCAQKEKLSNKVKKTILSPSDSDPLGMYTGKPTQDEEPMQDADDL
ncbi:MAG: hypothetical protein J6J21_00985 [Clostridia bacterium]|nr:hypothetical protein [Clostridia bacterium]